MTNIARRAIPASEKNRINVQMIKKPEIKIDNEIQVETQKSVNFFVPLLKTDKDECIVYGVVLQPETVDAQGDIYSVDVVKAAAHKFLAKYNKATKLGFMHVNFNKNFELLESYIAPQPLIINDKVIKQGSWLMAVKVIDAKVWESVKSGKITGFSIGGKAQVKKIGQ